MNEMYISHRAANHKESRFSPNGISIIIECDTCRLGWFVPDKTAQDQSFITLFNWYNLKPYIGGSKHESSKGKQDTCC